MENEEIANLTAPEKRQHIADFIDSLLDELAWMQIDASEAPDETLYYLRHIADCFCTCETGQRIANDFEDTSLSVETKTYLQVLKKHLQRVFERGWTVVHHRVPNRPPGIWGNWEDYEIDPLDSTPNLKHFIEALDELLERHKSGAELLAARLRVIDVKVSSRAGEATSHDTFPRFNLDATFRIFHQLLHHRGFVTNRQLAEKLRLGASSVTNARKELRSLNFIEENGPRSGFRLVEAVRTNFRKMIA